MDHAKLVDAMVEYEAGCPQRAHHFLAVHGFAKAIAELEGMDGKLQDIIEAAAIAHDIGIRPSLEKYGDAAGHHQEAEGPPVAAKMLAALGYPKDMTDRVCFLISKHHTCQGVDGPDWQVLLEADFLVNAANGQYSAAAIAAFRQNVFKTAAGTKMLDFLYPDILV